MALGCTSLQFGALGFGAFGLLLSKFPFSNLVNATITSVDVDVLCLPGARLIFSLSLDVWPLGWGGGLWYKCIILIRALNGKC